MASSSSSSSPSSMISQGKYDVFLSFRGEDTRASFTSHLYAALCQKQIQTFIDDDGLTRGDEISPALLKAIEESKISLIIFSKDYASSKWCLDELVKILECKKIKGQMVIPVFYNVNPSDVRKQTGSFKDAFVKHEEYFKGKIEKVQRFRTALTEASNLSGWDSLVTRPDSKLVDEIVKDVLKKLNDISPSSDCEGLVGLESRVEQVKSLLCSGFSDFRVVGIWGMGGIGKTTIAEAIFKQVSGQFDGCCFIENVREESKKCGGLARLREQVISRVLDERNLSIGTPNMIPQFIKHRLRCKKVFIILDDVNDSEQLEFLTGGLDRFGPGSRVIITTRDKQVLGNFGVDNDNIYEVERFKHHEALQLFCNFAFQQNHPPNDFLELSSKVVDYAKGNPLALKVLASSLHKKSKRDWESALNKLKKISNPKIHNILRISYDGLDREEQDIFLDIACFFEGEDSNHVTRILDGCYFSAHYGLSVLIDKSLITISSKNKLQMHDLLQEMGWEIVRQVSFKEPGKHSRLWNPEDVCNVLKKNTGTDAIEGLFLDMSKIREMHLSSEAFTNMRNLRLLKFYVSDQFSGGFVNNPKLCFPQGLEYLSDELRYLYWVGFPLKTLPPRFSPEKLIELNLPYSNIEQLWIGTKHLIEIPDVSEAPNIEIIELQHCTNLVKVPSSIQYLNHLRILRLSGCKSLRNFPSNIHFKSLVTLNLSSCIYLTEFPRISGNIRDINLSGTAIEEVPSSIMCLTELCSLVMTRCSRLKSISTSICKLKSLQRLELDYCSKLESFPEILEKMESLERLLLNGATEIRELPSSIEHLNGLRHLRLMDCKNLETIPSSICNLTSLIEMDLSGCSKLVKLSENSTTQWKGNIYSQCPGFVLPPLSALCSLTELFLSFCNLTEIPEDLCCISSLKTLNLNGNNFKTLPSRIKQLSKLKRLYLRDCNMLQSLPELPPCLRVLIAMNCKRLQSLPKLPSSLEELDASELEVVSERYVPFSWITMRFLFTNCQKLNQNAYNILELSQLRIYQMAVTSLRLCYEKVLKVTPAISFCLPGTIIPNWFSYRSSGSSITIQLPQHWCNTRFIRFALCGVIEFEESYCDSAFYVTCDYHFDTNSADYYSCQMHVTMLGYDYVLIDPDHIVLGYDPCLNARLLEGDYTTASFHFYPVEYGGKYCEVKCCGVCPLYTQFAGTSTEKESGCSGEEIEPNPKRVCRE
ncbi:disease resistance-like protein DSC1 isoform X2 [Pistacia vera]|uniref:disease resistance-like protein DSC1 isoform X2 n=1 Tax=Pistacia vera TaxID=55513 RepID=UPI001262F5D7|nr:disease resistance-like protein DSC1 isoform X2 [Pistacia vera]